MYLRFSDIESPRETHTTNNNNIRDGAESSKEEQNSEEQSSERSSNSSLSKIVGEDVAVCETCSSMFGRLGSLKLFGEGRGLHHKNNAALIKAAATKWMRQCLENHTKCSNNMQPSSYPTRLLQLSDSKVRLVIPSHETIFGPYGTLSYCWEDVKAKWALTTSNLTRRWGVVRRASYSLIFPLHSKKLLPLLEVFQSVICGSIPSV